MNRDLLCRELETSLSHERLLAYRQQGEQDSFNAVARYLWNTALCETFYPALQCFEIVLRNAVHDSLCDYYRPDWLLDNTFLRSYEQGNVSKAEDDLIKQNKPVTPGRVVAELPLGFWAGLFVAEYDRSVAVPAMKKGLRNFPNRLRNRRVLYGKFDEVRHLRNRVAHYEPIWYWEDLPNRHKDIVDYIGYISPAQQTLNLLLDRFDTVYDSGNGWKQIRARIGAEILTQTS